MLLLLELHLSLSPLFISRRCVLGRRWLVAGSRRRRRNGLFGGALCCGRSWLAQAEALRFDSLELRRQRLGLAFIEGDQGAVDRIFDGEVHGPNRASFLRMRSIFEAQQGHLDSANRLQLQAPQLSSDPEDISWALVFSALQDAEAGKVVEARKIEDQALQSRLDRNQRMVLALSLARSGRTDDAERLADEVSREHH